MGVSIERAKYSASSSAVLLSNGMISGSLKNLEHSVQDSVIAYLSFAGIITKDRAKSYLDGGYALDAISEDTKLVSDFYSRHHDYISKGEIDNGLALDFKKIVSMILINEAV